MKLSDRICYIANWLFNFVGGFALCAFIWQSDIEEDIAIIIKIITVIFILCSIVGYVFILSKLGRYQQEEDTRNMELLNKLYKEKRITEAEYRKQLEKSQK